jgi:hypothetical protein
MVVEAPPLPNDRGSDMLEIFRDKFLLHEIDGVAIALDFLHLAKVVHGVARTWRPESPLSGRWSWPGLQHSLGRRVGRS